MKNKTPFRGYKSNKMMEENISIKKKMMNNKPTGSQFKLDSSAFSNEIAKAAEALLNTEATATDSCCGAAGDVEKTFPRLFDCQNNLTANARLCTEKEFDAMLDNQQVANITKNIYNFYLQLQRGEITQKKYDDIKDVLKKDLSAFSFGSHSMTGRCKKTDSLLSGLATLDIDHMGCEPRELYEDKIKGYEKELGIAIVHQSAGCQGLHLAYEMKASETREEANDRIFISLGLDKDPRVPEGWDPVVKDPTRRSFVVPRNYFFYVDRDLLFHRTDDPQLFAAAQAAAATKHSTASKASASSVASAQPKSCGDASKASSHIQDDMTQEQALVIFDRVCTEIADIDIKALDVQNHRHNNLMTVLSTGITKVVPMELMLKVVEQRMPSYATETECKSLIKDFYGQYLTPNLPITKQLRAIRNQVLGLTSKATADDDVSDEADTWENRQLQLSDRITKLLPPGLSDTLFGVPRDMKMPVLVAVLPIAAAHASHVRVEYLDGATHCLGLMSAIIAPSGSGKGLCARRVQPWMKKWDEESKQAFKAEDECNEKSRTRKSNEKAPKDPHLVMHKVPFNISPTRLLYRMKIAEEQDLTLCSFCEELAAVISSNNRGEWSNKRTAYLAAFDAAEWSQDFQSAESVSGSVNMRYNWSVTGTPDAMNRFFKGDAIGGGFTSRVFTATMPDTSFQPLIKCPQLSATNIAHIDEAVEKLCAAKGTLKLNRISKAIEAWLENKRLEAMANGDHAAAYFRKRDAVIAFRCATVVYLLTGKERESKKVVEFAELMAEYVFGEHMHLFAKAYDDTTVKASQEQQRYTVNGIIFDKLDTRFTRDDLAKLKRDATVGNLKKMIFDWKKAGWIKKIAKNTWEKTADYATLLSRSQQPQGYVRDGLG